VASCQELLGAVWAAALDVQGLLVLVMAAALTLGLSVLALGAVAAEVLAMFFQCSSRP